MRFGKLDVTEAQITMMIIMTLSTLFGTSFWSWQVFGFMPLRWGPLMFGTVVSILSLPSTIERILFGGTGKNGSTVAVSNNSNLLVIDKP